LIQIKKVPFPLKSDDGSGTESHFGGIDLASLAAPGWMVVNFGYCRLEPVDFSRELRSGL
jgi:hypothetical protein